MGKELIPQALTGGSALHDARNIHKLHGGWENALGLRNGGQRVQSRIRNRDHAHVRVDGAERVVLGRNLGARQRVEKSGLADVRQSNNATLDRHNSP